jgi:hypothetical protein
MWLFKEVDLAVTQIKKPLAHQGRGLRTGKADKQIISVFSLRAGRVE